jgi:peptide/nickel transport system substrate-binding protein
MHHLPARLTKVLLGLVLALVTTATALAATNGRAAAPILVVDKSFEIKTADPQRAFEPTASIVNRGVFDTLFTYNGSDVAHPVPLLVQSWKASTDAKTFRFTLLKDVRFADGTPLTSADVVFSLRRLVNLKGNPSFLLDGVTVTAAGKFTVVMVSKNPNSALPAILANTSLGIVNSALVKKNGGTDAADADKTDKAEQWFNSSDSIGAGSGPYVLKTYSTSSQIVLLPNPKYWGANKAAFSSVVVRNMIAPTQLINVQRGKHEVAIDLSSQQALSLKGSKSVTAVTTPSTWVFFMLANNNPAVSGYSSNKNFQQGVRYALDYAAIAGVAGPGAIQAPGIIPSMFLGALPQSAAVKQDLVKAKAAFAASGVGNEKITLEYPSNFTINGVLFDSLAQKIQANLQAAGLNVELAGAPVGTWLQRYRDGKMPFGLSLWGPDYPDPADYLAFLPGELVGLRAGWPAGSEKTVELLGAAARVSTNDPAREKVYQTIQKRLNAYGPFFPLLQPTQVFVSTNDFANAKFNAVYSIDVTQTKPKA